MATQTHRSLSYLPRAKLAPEREDAPGGGKSLLPLRRANDYFSRSASRYASQLCAVPSAILLRNERGRSLTTGPGRVGGPGQGRAVRSRSRQTVEHGSPLDGSVGPETDPPVELHVPDLHTGHLAAARRPAAPRLVLRWGVLHRGAGDHEERDDNRR